MSASACRRSRRDVEKASRIGPPGQGVQNGRLRIAVRVDLVAQERDPNGLSVRKAVRVHASTSRVAAVMTGRFENVAVMKATTGAQVEQRPGREIVPASNRRVAAIVAVEKVPYATMATGRARRMSGWPRARGPLGKSRRKKLPESVPIAGRSAQGQVRRARMTRAGEALLRKSAPAMIGRRGVDHRSPALPARALPASDSRRCVSSVDRCGAGGLPRHGRMRSVRQQTVRVSRSSIFLSMAIRSP